MREMTTQVRDVNVYLADNLESQSITLEICPTCLLILEGLDMVWQKFGDIYA